MKPMFKELSHCNSSLRGAIFSFYFHRLPQIGELILSDTAIAGAAQALERYLRRKGKRL